MLPVVLSVLVTTVVTAAVVRAGDALLDRVGSKTRWIGPGPEPSAAFLRRIGIGAAVIVLWLAVLFGVYALLEQDLPPA